MPSSQEEAVKAELAKISFSYGGRRTQFLSAQKTYASKIKSFVSAHNDTVLAKLNEQAKAFEEKFQLPLGMHHRSSGNTWHFRG